MKNVLQEGYLMGNTQSERNRLSLQASILEPYTEALFRKAGVSSGMRVLEMGCGVGDVSGGAHHVAFNKCFARRT